MEEPSYPDMIKDLHKDLVREYDNHAAVVEQYWRSFDKKQRTDCIKAGLADGAILKHPLDPSLGVVYKIIPEINLRDITTESEFLLVLLKHRATNTLLDQYMAGPNGGPGDHAIMEHSMETRNLRLKDPVKDGFTLFLDGDKYGRSFEIMRDAPEAWAAVEMARRANLCVPQELGDLILQRQLYMLQTLNIVIEDILDIGSTTRETKKPSRKFDKGATAALSKFIVQEPAKRMSLPDLTESAVDQKATLQEYLTLLSTEPVILAHAVNRCFFSRPELLPDERGRVLPAHTDKYISGAVLEVVYKAIKAAAIWNYIVRLLHLLASQPAVDKIYKAIILQEISNVCHLEYSRAQALAKRNLQIATGAKWFKRISNVYNKAGEARVTMKGDPEVLRRSDPQLYYMARLCQPETNVLKATEWMMKLSDLYEAHPSELEKLEEREADSLSDLAIVTSFLQNLAPVISLPTLSRKKNQMFVARSQELDAEINELKPKIDLSDFVVPIDNLLEPGVATKTLSLLDNFIIDNAGTKMGFLYQDLVEECFVEMERQYESAKSETAQNNSAAITSFPLPAPQPREKRVEQRKQKEKTRPSHPSVYEIVAPPPEAEPLEEEQPTIFKVRASTAAAFQTLFAKGARGSVSWTAFVSAMTDLGFSVQPKIGSIYTFSPPESMSVSKSLTLHRPHISEIERYHATVYAIRLRRVYGWNAKTFEVDG